MCSAGPWLLAAATVGPRTHTFPASGCLRVRLGCCQSCSRKVKGVKLYAHLKQTSKARARLACLFRRQGMWRLECPALRHAQSFVVLASLVEASEVEGNVCFGSCKMSDVLVSKSANVP